MDASNGSLVTIGLEGDDLMCADPELGQRALRDTINRMPDGTVILLPLLGHPAPNRPTPLRVPTVQAGNVGTARVAPNGSFAATAACLPVVSAPSSSFIRSEPMDYLRPDTIAWSSSTSATFLWRDSSLSPFSLLRTISGYCWFF